MQHITLLTGKTIEFEPFPYDEKNLIKLNLNRDGKANGEGIWVVISEKDRIDHDANKSGGMFVGKLVNHAIRFYPNASWGLYVVGEFRGFNRPVANLNWVDYNDPNNRFWSDEVPEEAKNWNNIT